MKTHKEVKREILKILNDNWVEGGNQRLFQFLFNYTNLKKGHKPVNKRMHVYDPFYNTDEETFECLKNEFD